MPSDGSVYHGRVLAYRSQREWKGSPRALGFYLTGNHGMRGLWVSRLRLPFALVLALIAASSCGAPVPPQPVSEEEAARTRAELDDRSFRQF